MDITREELERPTGSFTERIKNQKEVKDIERRYGTKLMSMYDICHEHLSVKKYRSFVSNDREHYTLNGKLCSMKDSGFSPVFMDVNGSVRYMLRENIKNVLCLLKDSILLLVEIRIAYSQHVCDDFCSTDRFPQGKIAQYLADIDDPTEFRNAYGNILGSVDNKILEEAGASSAYAKNAAMLKDSLMNPVFHLSMELKKLKEFRNKEFLAFLNIGRLICNYLYLPIKEQLFPAYPREGEDVQMHEAFLQSGYIQDKMEELVAIIFNQIIAQSKDDESQHYAMLITQDTLRVIMRYSYDLWDLWMTNVILDPDTYDVSDKFAFRYHDCANYSLFGELYNTETKKYLRSVYGIAEQIKDAFVPGDPLHKASVDYNVLAPVLFSEADLVPKLDEEGKEYYTISECHLLKFDLSTLAEEQSFSTNSATIYEDYHDVSPCISFSKMQDITPSGIIKKVTAKDVDGDSPCTCPCCGKKLNEQQMRYRFCPNCGTPFHKF